MKKVFLFSLISLFALHLGSQTLFRCGIHNEPDSMDFYLITSDPNDLSTFADELALPDSQRVHTIGGKVAKTNGGFNAAWNWHLVPGQSGEVFVCIPEDWFSIYDLIHIMDTTSLSYKFFCIDQSYVKANLGVARNPETSGIAARIWSKPESNLLLCDISDASLSQDLPRLELYSLSGQKLYAGDLTSLHSQISFDYPAGVYFWRLQSQTGKGSSGKVLVY